MVFTRYSKWSSDQDSKALLQVALSDKCWKLKYIITIYKSTSVFQIIKKKV